MSRLCAARASVVTALTVSTAAASVVFAPAASAYPTPTVVRWAPDEDLRVYGEGCFDPARPAWQPPSVTVRGTWFVVSPGATMAGQWETAIPDPPRSGTYTITATCELTAGPAPYPPATLTVVAPPPPAAAPPAAPAPTPSAAVPLAPAPRTTAPGTTPPRTTASTTATSSTQPTVRSPASPTSSAATTPAPRTAAVGCTDCERLTSEEPVTAGAALTLAYAGFQPGEQVTLIMRSRPVELGTFTADSAGVVTAAVTLPASAEAGSHTLTFSGPATGDHVVHFRLAEPEQARKTPAAPASTRTGLAVPLGLGGVVLVLLTGGGLLLHRRRAAQADEPREEPACQPTDTPIAEPIA